MNPHFRASLTAAALMLFSLAAQPLPAQSPIPAPPPAAPPGAPNATVELDRNGDGKVDYRVIYDAKGNILREEMDFNYDGVMDTFYYYMGGTLSRVEIDSKNTGKIDIWVYLVDGKYIQRYERDTTGSGKPDIVKVFGGS